MRKAISFVKDNKKIIVIITLIIVLVGTIYFLNGRKESSVSTATTAQKSATEVKLTGILNSIEGVGATEVMINENNGEVLGVVIVCQGANNIMVRNDILNATSTALSVDKKIIAIYSMN